MTISEETLMAYADGELDAAARASVEAAMREDPEIRKRVARHRALREAMQGAFSAVLKEPVPERLLEAARGQPAAPKSTVVNLPLAREAARNHSASPRRWQPAAMAASLLLGLALGFLAWHGSRGALIQTAADGGLIAGATLAEALSTQLSDDRSAERVAVTGLSFRNKSGDYCRTFSLTQSDASSGLACREGTDWRIKALAQSPRTAADSGNYRTAASEDSPAIRAVVEGSIDGEPLDHRGEIAARQGGWAAAAKR
jgi:anti-sigma factor ChrR (cupin superfamily)